MSNAIYFYCLYLLHEKNLCKFPPISFLHLFIDFDLKSQELCNTKQDTLIRIYIYKVLTMAKQIDCICTWITNARHEILVWNIRKLIKKNNFSYFECKICMNKKNCIRWKLTVIFFPLFRFCFDNDIHRSK